MKPRNTLMQRIAALALAALTVSGSAVYADEAAQPGVAMLTMPQSAPEVSMRDADDTAAAYDVWFDGTIGLKQVLEKMGRSQVSTYFTWASDTHMTVTDAKITLPTTAAGEGVAEANGYKLNGWYDVYNQTYYGADKLGTEIPVTKKTVFYADWVPASYDYGKDTGRAQVPTVPDTSGFITTDMFDYNELFNLRSAQTDKVDAPEVLDGATHREFWRLQSGGNWLNFSFLNWAYQESLRKGGSNNSGYRTLGALSGLDNTWNETKSEITQGILTNAGEGILTALFTKSNDLGRTYVGQGDYLYQYDPSNGYYYYDSAKNGVSYNQTDGRFYLYKTPEYVHEQQLKGDAWGDKTPSKETTAFLPFNDNTAGVYNEKDGTINYWFGMQSTIDFWLPNDPYTDGNKSDKNLPMEFYFSGDDDVWVFVDDTLVLDLGGIHGARTGSINFSTGEVKTQTERLKDGTAVYATTQLPDKIKSGNHKLTIYYLERGSSQSNCAIYFNIAPKYALSIQKKDATSGESLAGAKFGIYTDEACTQPAILWANVAEEGDSRHEFTTDAKGAANCYGMVAGNTYYIKELQAPDGYKDPDGTPIRVTLDNDGNATAAESADFRTDVSDKRFYLTITNEKTEQPPTPTEKPDKPKPPVTPVEPEKPEQPTKPNATATPMPAPTAAPAAPVEPETPAATPAPTATAVPTASPAPQTTSTPAPAVSAIPQTGDSAAPPLWLAVMALALAGMAVTYYKKKTR